MRKLALTALALAIGLPALARAQASVQLRLDLPVVLPQLVVVSPGVQVVPEVEEEVFFTNGYYWCRHDGGWYRSRDYRRGWVYMAPRGVPPGLARIPPGKYRHYRPGPGGRPVAAPAYYRGAPAPAPRYERRERWDDDDRDRGHERHHDRGEDHDRGEGHGRGHWKHGD